VGAASHFNYTRDTLENVAATGLAAQLEVIRQPFEDSHRLFDGADLGATDNLACRAEHEHEDPLAVDI
jgi:hypothetical protein